MWGIPKIAGVALLAQLAFSTLSWAVEVGERMPDFGVQTFAGNTVSRESVAGKPVLIIFWNTWCPTCRRELPQVSQIAEKLSPKGLAVLAINTGLNDSEGKARAYWKKYGYAFPSGFDRSFEIGQAFRLAGVPTVLLVDRKGIVRYKDSALPDNMEERLKELTVR